EFGEHDAIDAAGDDGLFHQYGIEPAAAAFASGDGAEFRAALPQLFTDVVLLFGREGAFANTRRVGFHDAQHITDIARRNARACRRLSRHSVGRSDIRIGTVIDVEQHRLRAFEQDAFAFAAERIETTPGAASEGKDF